MDKNSSKQKLNQNGRSWVEVSLIQLKCNIDILKDMLAEKQEIMAVVFLM